MTFPGIGNNVAGIELSFYFNDLNQLALLITELFSDSFLDSSTETLLYEVSASLYNDCGHYESVSFECNAIQLNEFLARNQDCYTEVVNIGFGGRLFSLADYFSYLTLRGDRERRVALTMKSSWMSKQELLGHFSRHLSVISALVNLIMENVSNCEVNLIYSQERHRVIVWN